MGPWGSLMPARTLTKADQGYPKYTTDFKRSGPGRRRPGARLLSSIH